MMPELTALLAAPELPATLAVLPFLYVMAAPLLQVDPRRFLVNLPVPERTPR